MFGHLFRLIWNKRRRNILLLTEMLISFLVLFAVFTLMVYYWHNYHRPEGIEYEDVWVINFNTPPAYGNTDSLSAFYAQMKRELKGLPLVREVSLTGLNYPFSRGRNMMGNIEQYRVGDGYKEILGLRMQEGRWFTAGDAFSRDRTVVLTAALKAQLFGGGDAVGKRIDMIFKQMLVIGVLADIKSRGDYAPPVVADFMLLDSGDYPQLRNVLVRMAPGATAVEEGRIYKTMTHLLQSSDVNIEHLSNKLQDLNRQSIIPVSIVLIVACFLLINVALGLFGVLWYTINQRRTEIGLRRAVGATGWAISGQMIGEAFVLASLSLAVGCFFAVQFPLLKV